MKDLGNIKDVMQKAMKQHIGTGNVTSYKNQYVFKRQSGQYRRLVATDKGYCWLNFDFTRTNGSNDFLHKNGTTLTYQTIEDAVYAVVNGEVDNYVDWIKRFDDFVEFCQYVANESN